MSIYYAKVEVINKYVRPGDYNRNVKVYGIVTRSGHKLETCGNLGGHKTHSNTLSDWDSIKVGSKIDVAYGKGSGKYPLTFIGVK